MESQHSGFCVVVLETGCGGTREPSRMAASAPEMGPLIPQMMSEGKPKLHLAPVVVAPKFLD